MLSMDYTLNVPGFSQQEIGYGTLVRVHRAKVQFTLTNKGQAPLGKLSIRPVLESYIGQEKPQLFQWYDTQIIRSIPPEGMAPLIFEIWPNFPGLVSVAVYVTGADGNAIMAKRATSSTYERLPVRWWFHVADDISIQTLKVLKRLQEKGGSRDNE